MRTLINKNTQEKVKDYISPILKKELEKEYKKRKKITNDKKVQEKYSDAPEILKYRQKRKLEFDLLTKVASLYSELDETSREIYKETFCWYTDQLNLAAFVKDKEAAIVKFNTATESRIELEIYELVSKEYGTWKGEWTLYNELERELEARLATQPVASFSEVVEKLIKDIKIDNFFNKQ
jgi:hypothetical protein